MDTHNLDNIPKGDYFDSQSICLRPKGLLKVFYEIEIDEKHKKTIYMTFSPESLPRENTPLLFEDSPLLSSRVMSVNHSEDNFCDNIQELSPQLMQNDTLFKPYKWRSVWKSLVLYLLTIVMVIAKSCDTVLYVRLTYEIQNYM